MAGSPVFEAKVSRKRLLTIPKEVAERLGIAEGSKVRIYVEGDRMVVEPVRDAFWFALHGPKIGFIDPEELEEESEREQRKIAGPS